MRKEKALSSDDIEKALNTYCCRKECSKKVLNKEDILKCRKNFRSLSEEDQRAFLLKFFTFRVYHHKGTVYKLKEFFTQRNSIFKMCWRHAVYMCEQHISRGRCCLVLTGKLLTVIQPTFRIFLNLILEVFDFHLNNFEVFYY